MIKNSFSYTHPGHIRKVNEDSYYSSNKDGLWLVCDGMGGHDDGNFASHLVTDTFEYLKLGDNFEENIKLFEDKIYKIHEKLLLKVQRAKRAKLIGTTVILLYIKDNKAASIFCGDSRCYNLRDDKLSLVSSDHTQEIMTKEGIKKVLTKALYAPGEVSLEIKKFIVKKDDVFLLCSDGFYDNLKNSDIKNAMKISCLEEATKSLSRKVLQSKADDNLTAILVGIK